MGISETTILAVLYVEDDFDMLLASVRHGKESLLHDGKVVCANIPKTHAHAGHQDALY